MNTAMRTWLVIGSVAGAMTVGAGARAADQPPPPSAPAPVAAANWVDPATIAIKMHRMNQTEIELATRVDAAGVLLFGAIDSVPLTAARLFPYVPTSYLTRNQFDSHARIQALHVPVVMVHAIDDELVPLSAARAMFQEIRAPKLMVPTDGGHHDSGFTGATNLGVALAKFWPLDH